MMVIVGSGTDHDYDSTCQSCSCSFQRTLAHGTSWPWEDQGPGTDAYTSGCVKLSKRVQVPNI